MTGPQGRFKHPCAETCSGYRQGYEDGAMDQEVKLASCCVANEEENKNLRRRLARALVVLRRIDAHHAEKLCIPSRKMGCLSDERAELRARRDKR